jgi:hypothetical protein
MKRRYQPAMLLALALAGVVAAQAIEPAAKPIQSAHRTVVRLADHRKLDSCDCYHYLPPAKPDRVKALDATQ